MADTQPKPRRNPRRDGSTKSPEELEKERREAERHAKELEKIAKLQKKRRDGKAALRASGQIEITGDGYTINKPAGTITCTAGEHVNKTWKDTEEHREAFKASADNSKQRKARKRTKETKKKREATGGTISNPGNFRPIQPSAIVEQPRKRVRVVLDGERFDPLANLVVTIGGKRVYDVRLQFVPKAIVTLPPTVAAPPSAAAFFRPVTPDCEAPTLPRRPFDAPSKPYIPKDLKKLERSILRKAPRDPWLVPYTAPSNVNEYSLPPGTEAKYLSNCEKLADWKETPTGSTANVLRLCAKLMRDRCELLEVRRALPTCVPAPPEIFFGLHEGAPFELAKFLYRRGKELASEKGIPLLAAANELLCCDSVDKVTSRWGGSRRHRRVLERFLSHSAQEHVSKKYLESIHGQGLSSFQFRGLVRLYRVGLVLGVEQAAPQAMVLWPSPLAEMFAGKALPEGWERIMGSSRVKLMRSEIGAMAQRKADRDAAGIIWSGRAAPPDFKLALASHPKGSRARAEYLAAMRAALEEEEDAMEDD